MGDGDGLEDDEIRLLVNVVDPEVTMRCGGMGWMQGVVMKGAIQEKKKAATDHLTIKQEGVRNQHLISQGGR